MYWFVTYTVGREADICNTLVRDQHPIDWFIQFKNSNRGRYCTLLFYAEIREDQFEKWEENI